MAVLKCKMCGGELDFQEGMTVCECEYCGSKQTIPIVDDEKKMKLFDRANRLRINCEFDKAGNVYESIIDAFSEEPEGYWGNLLCKYGIEYVDDPVTGDKVPTCHRSSFESFMDEEDFELVMENADPIARRVYREQAKQIEEIRKGIMEVSAREEPYDIFICYKETDESGDRTLDSVLAQDVYDALVGKGYHVFFSRISLEDKLGTEYEPFIFAALNSAKIMLAFGTSYDYYNAVWVKNEWSRFLRLMAKDKGKYLIPCYKNLDAYDIPKEFAKLQAQDMGKVGALQDLLRGIDKIFGRDDTQNIQGQHQVMTGVANADALLKRGSDALEDGAFDEANKFFNEVLNSNAESADAYLGLFMAGLKCRDKDSARQKFIDGNYTDNRYWKRAVQYARNGIADELKGWEGKREVRLKSEEEAKCKEAEEARKKEEEARKKEEEAKRKRIEEDEKREAELADIRSQIENINAGNFVLGPKEREELSKLKADAETARRAAEQAEAEFATMPEHELVKKFEMEITNKKGQFAGVSLFKRKEKKNLQQQISELEQSMSVTSSILEERSTEISRLQDEYRVAQRKADTYTEQAADIVRKELWRQEQFLILGASKVGDNVYFGQYEQGNGVQPIEWRVLEYGKKLLLITEYGIDYKKYNESKRYITWENCSLRKWLNQEFLNKAFSEGEKAIIMTTEVKADLNPKYNISPGNDTFDKVFLLSIPEILKYMPLSEDRVCFPTDYVENSETYVCDKTGSRWWWLRSPGKDGSRAASVDDDGEVSCYGSYVYYGSECIRPAIWIDLNSSNI